MSKKCNTAFLLFSIIFSAGLKGSDTQKTREDSFSSLSKSRVYPEATSIMADQPYKYTPKLEKRINELDGQDLNQLDLVPAVQLYEEIEDLLSKNPSSRKDISLRALSILENLDKRIKQLLSGLRFQDGHGFGYMIGSYYGGILIHKTHSSAPYRINAFELKKLLAGDRIYIFTGNSVYEKAMVIQKENDIYELDTDVKYCKNVIFNLLKNQLYKIGLLPEDFNTLEEVYNKLLEEKQTEKWSAILKDYNSKNDQKLYKIARKISLSPEEYKYLMEAIYYLYYMSSWHSEDLDYSTLSHFFESGEQIIKESGLKLIALREIPKIEEDLPMVTSLRDKFSIRRNDDPILFLMDKLKNPIK